MIVYEIMVGKTSLITDEASEVLYYAREALENGYKSIFIEVRKMSEEEFEALEAV